MNYFYLKKKLLIFSSLDFKNIMKIVISFELLYKNFDITITILIKVNKKRRKLI